MRYGGAPPSAVRCGARLSKEPAEFIVVALQADGLLNERFDVEAASRSADRSYSVH